MNDFLSQIGMQPQGSSNSTPDDLRKRQMLAQELMKQGSSSAPIGSWTQGLANVASSALGSYENNQINQAQDVAKRRAYNATQEAAGLAPKNTTGWY